MRPEAATTVPSSAPTHVGRRARRCRVGVGIGAGPGAGPGARGLEGTGLRARPRRAARVVSNGLGARVEVRALPRTARSARVAARDPAHPSSCAASPPERAGRRARPTHAGTSARDHDRRLLGHGRSRSRRSGLARRVAGAHRKSNKKQRLEQYPTPPNALAQLQRKEIERAKRAYNSSAVCSN